ncbi:hypothetical protein ACQ143_10655 [Microbacterium sp. MC2]
MSKKRKQTGGNPAARRGASFNTRVVLREFEAWLGEAGGNGMGDIAEDVADLARVFVSAQARGIELSEPDGVAALLDVAYEADDDTIDGFDIMTVLAIVDQYVHFRLDTAAESDSWAGVHDLVEGAAEEFSELGVVRAAIAETAEIPEADRVAALAELPMVAGVRELLDFIGDGRPVTSSAALRRGDIEPVARMLGVRAEGIAKLPPYRADDPTQYVTSMWDLGPVAAWWESLRRSRLITVNTSRVRPGERAADWLAGSLPPYELADLLVGVHISEVITSRLLNLPASFGRALWKAINARLLDVLESADAPVDIESDTDLDDVWSILTMHVLARLAEIGVLTEQADGSYGVPAEFAGTLARALSVARVIVEQVLPDTDDDDLDGDDDYADGDDFADGEFDDVANPFDDPEVRAQMAAMGIVHRPGLAKEMLGELAPLLAEEGFDIDNLEADDLDAFNDALQRATERHNMTLFTPVGAQRERAVTVLALLAEALAEGSDATARIVLDGIPSDPDGERPSVAQVMGAGLGLLDTWHGRSALGAGVARTRMPEWNASAQAAARDILGFAGQGSAFASLDQIIRRHTGKSALEGVALAVAASVAARAAQEGIDVPTMARRMVLG